MKKRGGKGRKRVNNISYHGIVIGGNKLNVNNLFSNYIINRKVKNINDPVLKSTLVKTLNYIIQKRQNVINRQKKERNEVNTNAAKRRYNGHIRVHQRVLNNYKAFSNAYKKNTVTTPTMYNVYKYGYLKNVNNTGQYRYHANLGSARKLIVI